MELKVNDDWIHADDVALWNMAAKNVLTTLSQLTDRRFPWPLRDRYNMGGLPSAEERRQYSSSYELVMAPVAWQWWSLVHSEVTKAIAFAPCKLDEMVCLHCLSSLVPHVTIGIGGERRSDIPMLDGADALPKLNLESRPRFMGCGITISAWGWPGPDGPQVSIELEFDNEYAVSMARKAMMSSRRDAIAKLLKRSGMWIYADEKLKGHVKSKLIHNLGRALELPGVVDPCPQASFQLVRRFLLDQTDKVAISEAIAHTAKLWREFAIGFAEIQVIGGNVALL